MDAPTTPTTSVQKQRSLSNKKRTIIGALVAVLLILAIAAGTYAYMWYQSPERIILNAVLNTANSSSIGFQGKASLSSADMSVKGRMVDDKMALSGSGTITLAGKKMDLNGDVLLIGDKTYVKSNQLGDIAPEAFGVADNAVAMNALNMIKEKVNSQWVELDSNSSKILSGGDESSACLADFMQKVAPSQPAKLQLVDLYRQNPFIKIATKSHDAQQAVYNLSIDLEKFLAFKVALKKTELHKTMISCTNDTPIMNEDQARQLSIQLTVDTKKLLVTNVALNEAGQKTSTDVALTYDAIQPIDTPAQSVKVSELRNEVMRGFITQQLRQFITR
ncbi:MAG: hypothetical protein EOO17_05660 [Chloroflexi bacterium]|nr:MAG: hypothetical protein EOO17_05660 [Chloroflexota bacterium]